VAFADGFGAPIGTGAGQDNFWYPNEGNCCNASEDKSGNNGNELEVYNSSQVKVGSEGLELVDSYWPNRQPGKNYVSGAVQTFSQYTAVGYRPFTWEPNHGETWAFECYCRLPVNTGEVDPGWWSTDWSWHDEFDYFEEWGWSKWTSPAPTGVTWIYETSGLHMMQSWHSLYLLFDPSVGFHRYTTVINHNNTVEEYIDGVRQTWLGTNGILPAPPHVTAAKMALILSNALRQPDGTSGGTAPSFTSGSRYFDARSIAVYQDGGHAGQNVEGGGIAPGTVVK